MHILKQADQWAYHQAAEMGPPAGEAGPRPPMSADEKAGLGGWNETRNALREIGGRYRENPVTLKDGRQTHVYLDPKNVFSTGRHLNNVSHAMINHAAALGLNYNAVGGPTMGGDVISHGVAAHHPNQDMGWFSIRDRAKTDHGLGKWIEGTELGPQHNVLLTDDVADSGKSLVDAYHKVRDTGANVAAVMPVVDRGDQTKAQFDQLGVPYHPLMNYSDLGIDTLQQQQPQQPQPQQPPQPQGQKMALRQLEAIIDRLADVVPTMKNGKRVLVVVDPQNDFINGSLPVPGGEQVAQRLHGLMTDPNNGYDHVVTTQDWHTDPGSHWSDHPDFKDSWPTHGKANSWGAALHPALANDPVSERFYKGQHGPGYSGFEGTTNKGQGLADWLHNQGATHVDVAGLALDKCVAATAHDAHKEGFHTTVLPHYSAPVTPEGGHTALKDMAANGIKVGG